MFPLKLYSHLRLYNIKIHFYNQFWICISTYTTPRNWTVDPHICTFALIFSTFFSNLLCLFCVKFFSSTEMIFTHYEHVFLRILVTNLHVLCFDIYAIPTMCTPFYPSRLNLVCEICLVNILTFSAWGVTVIF